MAEAESDTPARERDRRTWVLLALVLAAAAGLRLMSLPYEAAWFDEVMILEHLDSPNLVQFVRDALPRTPVPPGFMVTEYLWSRVVGTDVFALRLWPVTCGLASLIALFGLSRRLLDSRTAVLAAGWLAFLHWHIYYSQEIRYYALTCLLAILSMWSFVAVAARPTAGRVALHVLANLVLVWSHPVAAFLCAAQAAFLLAFRRDRLRFVGVWFGLHALLAASLVAFLFSLDRDAAYAQAAWISRPSLWGQPPSVRDVLRVFSGFEPVTPTNGVGVSAAGFAPYTGWALVALHVGAAALGYRAVRRTQTHEADGNPSGLTRPETAALLVFWLIIPPAVVFIVSYLWRPMFIARYLQFASLPLFMLLAHWLAVRGRAVAGVAFGLLIAHGALFYFPGPQRWRGDLVTSYIENASVGSPVIYLDDMLLLPPIDYYWRNDETKPEFRNWLQMDLLIDPETRDPGPEERWLVFRVPRLYEKFTLRLDDAKIPYERTEFPSAKPLWVVRVRV